MPDSRAVAHDDDPLWHQQSVAAVLKALDARESGLTEDEVRARRRQYGRNQIAVARRTSALRMFLGQFTDFMILVLLAAAVVSGIIGDVKDTIVIAAIVVLNAVIGFVQEYRAEKAMDALRQMAAPTAIVLRNALVAAIPASDVVPGDVIILEAGTLVPADIRLISAFNLRIDESTLTGESHAVEKNTEPIEEGMAPLGDRANMAYMGTIVIEGRGQGVTTATNISTEFGKIGAMLQLADTVSTPLQRRLERFGKHLAIAALTLSGLVFLLGITRGEPFLLMLLTSISLAVAAIPEALPAVVTIALAMGARRMVQQNALIRKLPAVETLGSVTVICSDKTGTLTMNRMSVESLYCDGVAADRPGSGASWSELLRAMALSNDVPSNSDDRTLGDPTEVALFEAAKREGARKSELERDYPRIGEIPFDSDRKRMTTIHQSPNGGVISFTKGAVEAVLEKSISERSGKNEATIDSTRLLESAEAMAANGLRVIAFAVRYWSDVPSPLTVETAETGLQFLGLAGIGDPVREEARDAVAMCRRAGITPIMITGDHPLTARAVAKSLGILSTTDEIVTGREISGMSPNKLLERARTARVYARVAPEQKLSIVRVLQSHGHVVAMTGDGVNDAPALKQAEIGIAMGISGTGVAKEASAMILLDDNFATIVRAVREGRRIYDNLRRFVRFAITTNASEVWIMFFAPLLGLPIPLLPIQILWINLITDGLPGLALAAEPEEKHLMTRPPRPPNESIFAHGLGIHSLWVGVLMAAFVLGVQAIAIKRESSHWQTMVLSVMAFSQLGHVLAIRSERESLFTQGLFTNKPLIGAIVLTIALQLAVIYVPVANSLFNTLPLTPIELSITVATASLIFLAVEAEKLLKRQRKLVYG